MSIYRIIGCLLDAQLTARDFLGGQFGDDENGKYVLDSLPDGLLVQCRSRFFVIKDHKLFNSELPKVYIRSIDDERRNLE